MSMFREQHGNIRARFEQGSRFVRVASLKGHETCFLDDFESKHPQRRIILHGQNNGRDLLGDPATTSMIGNVLRRNIADPGRSVCSHTIPRPVGGPHHRAAATCSCSQGRLRKMNDGAFSLPLDLPSFGEFQSLSVQLSSSTK